MLLVYATCATKKLAQKISRTIVEEKLVACAAVNGPVESVFYWGKRVKTRKEFQLFLKCRERDYPRVEQRIVQLHSDKTPCIFSMRPNNVFWKYGQWVESYSN